MKIPQGKVKRQEKVEKLRARREKLIRAESEETQDYVREAKDMDQEEDEEMSFVPGAICVPQKLLFRCDNQCSEKTLSFWQFASVVIKKSQGIIHDQFMPAMLQQVSGGKRDKPLTNWQWYGFAEKKAHRGRLWKMMGKEQYFR